MMFHAFKILLLAIVLSAWASMPVLAGFDEGKAAYNKGDYVTALKEFQPLAENENVEAQYLLGLLYRNGWGVEQDDHLAAKWIRLAAHQGYMDAQFSLGYMFEHGQGLTKDMVLAKHWYRLAANQGLSDAQQNLSIIYYEETNASKTQGEPGNTVMNSNPGNFVDTILAMLIGLDDAITVGDVLLITAIVLILLVPVIMPFSFYRIKPMIKEISDNAAERDTALLEEIRKTNQLLQKLTDDR